jgi:hypothetical protein
MPFHQDLAALRADESGVEVTSTPDLQLVVSGEVEIEVEVGVQCEVEVKVEMYRG